MEIELTQGALLTVAGAGVFAAVVAQFAKQLLNLGAGAVRTVALVTGLLVVMVVTIATTPDANVVTFILASFVGMQAGLSASGGFDALRSGIDYTVTE